MSNDTVPQHSGSRWEPSPTTDLAGSPTLSSLTGLGSAPAAVDPADRNGHRKRRGPLLAVLAAVLALGASTAGIAYVQAAHEPGTNDPAAVADSPHDRGPGLGAGDDDPRQGDHHHDGDRADGGSGARDDGDSTTDGTTGELPS